MSKRLLFILITVVYLSVWVNSSEARRIREETDTGLSGWRLFFGLAQEQKAGVSLLTKDSNILGNPREEGRDLSFSVLTLEEERTMIDLLHTPLNNEALILQRQKLTLDFIKQLDFDKSSSLRGGAYSFLSRLNYLLAGGNTSDYDRTNGLQDLFLSANPQDNEIANSIKSATAKDKKGQNLSAKEQLYLYLGNLEDDIKTVNSFISLLESVDNPDARAIAGYLRDGFGPLLSLTWQDLIDYERRKDIQVLTQISETSRTAKDLLGNIGGVLAFASYVKKNSDKFTPATFNPDAPIGYQDGYNFIRSLDKQVSNPSTKDVGCVVLTGPNESGKSYKLVSDLFIQLTGQSFGIVPAKNANLRLYRNIVYIDRSDTESNRNLSAFGAEEEKWQNLVNRADGSTMAYVDEGYSTTSPEDQYALFAASVDVLMRRGVHFEVATHNEDFISHFNDNPGFAFYNFGITIPKKTGGKITLAYKLEEGIADSQAIDIARNRGVSKSLLQSAQTYIDGKVVPLETSQIRTPVVQEVVRYTAEERQQLMQETRSLSAFFPGKGEMLEEEANWGSNIVMTQDASQADAQPFVLLSADEDFSKWGGLARLKYEGMNDRQLGLIQNMLLYGATTDSKELLERQRMFELLSQTPQLDGMLKQIQSIEHVMWLLAFGSVGIMAHHAEDFNIYLIDTVAKEMDKHSYNDDSSSARIDMFFSLLDFNMQLAGLNSESLGISADIAVVKRLVGIVNEYKEAERQSAEISVSLMGGEEDSSGEKMASWRQIMDKQEDLKKEYARLAGLTIVEDNIFADATIKIHEIIDSDGDRVDISRSFRPIIDRVLAVYAKVKDNFKPVSLFEVDTEKLKPLFSSLVDGANKAIESTLGIFVDDVDAFILLMDEMLKGGDPRADFLANLRSFDSVHLQQFANYFDKFLGIFFKTAPNLAAIWEMQRSKHEEYKNLTYQIDNFSELAKDESYLKGLCQEMIDLMDHFIKSDESMMAISQERLAKLNARPKEKRDEWWEMDVKQCQRDIESAQENIAKQKAEKEKYEHPYENLDFVSGVFLKRLEGKRNSLEYDRELTFSSESYKSLSKELFKFYAILRYATMIRDYGINKVEFTDQPVVAINNGWNMGDTEEEQVKNSITLDANSRVTVVSGSNMSGKTYLEKMVTRALLCAQVTGFSPADSMTTPIFDKIIYSDRVNPRSDLNLSAFANEVEIRKRISGILNQPNTLVFGALDEIFSTTSPKYQSALSFAFTEEFLRTGNFVMVASHNHDYIDTFSSTYPGYTEVGYLRNHPDDGKIVFDYIYEEGHQDSNAIEVARTLGFDEEILQLAEQIKQETESKP